MSLIITIDGPAASGKSTVAKGLARALGIHYLTSGFFYRAIAYAWTHDNNSCDQTYDQDELQLSSYLDSTRYTYQWQADGTAVVLVDGVDVTQFLKTPAMDKCASHLAQNSLVREFVFHLQRSIAQRFSVIVEGRDAGSVVFPHASVKFFLTADLETRARRWRDLQTHLGNHMALQEAIDLVAQRDTRDKERQLAPLVVPQEAIIIDTSHKTVDEVINEMLTHVAKISDAR